MEQTHTRFHGLPPSLENEASRFRHTRSPISPPAQPLDRHPTDNFLCSSNLGLPNDGVFVKVVIMKSQTCWHSAKRPVIAFFDGLKGLVAHHHQRVRCCRARFTNQIFLVPFIWLAGLGADTIQAAELSHLPKYQGSTVKPTWISKRLSLEDLESMIHTERIQQIIALSQIQSDKSNPWIIDGVKGSGMMPRAYYKEAITELLKDAPELIRLRREILPGDQLFQFDSLQTSERIGKGFIVVRAGQVIFEWWTHDY